MDTYFIVLLILMACAVFGREQGFVYCPAYPCLCEPRDGQLVINCKYMYLTELPKFLSFDGRVRELSLRKNSIRSLPSGAFRGLSIEVIDLTENIVTKVHEKAFIGLEDTLEELHIQVYAMQDLPVKALENLKKLRILNIIGCRVPTLKSDTFAGLTQLVELHLVSCRIGHIEPGGIGSLVNLQILNLANNQLRYQHLRDIGKLVELRNLNLAQNQIQALGSDAFADLLHLRYADLNANQIKTIDKNAFRNLEYSLEYLDLSKNNLKDSALASVRPLKNLRELLLSDNKLTDLSPHCIERLELLAKLDLERNKIQRLRTMSLRGTGRFLKVLKISGNPLQIIENNTFIRHQSLKELYLDETDLGGKIHKLNFLGLEKSLEIISLKNSNIESNDVPTFGNLESLQKLVLSDNKIKTIPQNSFFNMKKLQQILFSKNKISEIEKDAFHGLETTLQSIDFSSNNLSVISKCIFERFPHLSGIRLGNNPLFCDCKLVWLFNWLKLHQPNFRRSRLDWACSGPPPLKQKSFKILKISEFKCKNESKNETCEWTVDPIPIPINLLEAVPSPLLPVDMMGTKVTISVQATIRNVIIVSWNSTSTHPVGGYRIILRKANDSVDTSDITVTSEVKRQLFSNVAKDTEYKTCVIVLSTNVVPMGRDCKTILTKSYNSTALDQSKSFESSGFITLLWAYTLGSLAATGVFVMVAVCVLKRRKELKKAKAFSPGYPAWAGMLYGRPGPEHGGQGPPSCYFSSNSTGFDELDVNPECCNNHGRCSTVSTFRRHLPANYIVTSADLNDDFYFHF